MDAYLVLITWPDGREGLLFPRPGNVQIADKEKQGVKDWQTAVKHLMEYSGMKTVDGSVIRLVRFQRLETMLSYEHHTNTDD